MDDLSYACISFIQSVLAAQASPIIIAISGPQGVGKTTLVESLAATLATTHGLKTLTFSLDDFYFSYMHQLAFAAQHPDNQLLQHRGVPGTHDLNLLLEVLSALRQGRECTIPVYDKGARQGCGDRSSYRRINQAGEEPVAVVIFEGWCLGFRAISAIELEEKRASASCTTLHRHSLEHLSFLNEQVRKYECLVADCTAFIYLDALNLRWVYEWREEQERTLRSARGSDAAMTPVQVQRFVDDYYPAYELYSEKLRERFLDDTFRKDKHIRIVIGRDRKVVRKSVTHDTKSS
ncbi:hypothetical protein K3495_g2127 [Podosphaera aphanis]|nr:hypothetical protein K3495_g2127 [Podosphaera aphanis]